MKKILIAGEAMNCFLVSGSRGGCPNARECAKFCAPCKKYARRGTFKSYCDNYGGLNECYCTYQSANCQSHPDCPRD